MLRVGLGLICRLMLISYCHNESLFSNQAEHESLRKGFYTCTHFRSFKYNPFIFIYPKQNYEAALNNSGVSYWPSAKEESCNKLFLSDSLCLLKINANLSLPAGVPKDLCRQQRQATLPISPLSVSFMAHIHFVLQGGRPESSLLSSGIAR